MISYKYDRQTMYAIKDDHIHDFSMPSHTPRHRNKRKYRAGLKNALRHSDVKEFSFPTILSFNSRSLLNKVDDLRSILNTGHTSKSCVVCIQESWLNQDIDDSLVEIDRFKSFRADRDCAPRSRGGGVITYINSDWCPNPKKIMSFKSQHISCNMIKCKPKHLPYHEYVIVANIYIVPACSQSILDSFIDTFLNHITNFVNNSFIAICGDFNRCNSNFISQLGLNDIVNFHTRADAQLDHVFLTELDGYRCRKLAPIGLSDHAVIQIIPENLMKSVRHRTSLSSQSRTRIRMRDLSAENVEHLKETIASTDFNIFDNGNLSEYVEAVSSYLSFVYDIHCPIQTYYSSFHRIESSDLTRMRRQKERAYKRGDHQKVKELSRQISEEIQRINAAFTSNMTNCKDSKQIWEQINILTGRKGRRAAKCLDFDELNNLNRSFVGRCDSDPSAASDIPDLPIASGGKRIDAESTYRAIKSLRSCSRGSDGLDPRLLKLCALELTSPLTSLYQKCYDSLSVPSQWRISKITPIPKPNSDKLRPIASLPTLSKPLERLMLDEIKPCLQPDPMQFAYTRNRSPLDCLAILHHTILSTLDVHGQSYRCCFLDFSSAFNTICRQRLINKLVQLEVDTPTTILLHDFLSDRTQFCKMGDVESSVIDNPVGVIQGSILSPTLFATYVQDLKIPSADIFLKFADDFVFGSRSCGMDDPTVFQSSLSAFHNTCLEAKLYLNTEKCAEMIFTLRKSRMATEPTLLELGNDKIPRLLTTKYLGVFLSSDLSWTDHVQVIYRKLVKLSFYIKRLRQCKMPQHIILNFIQSCVIPVIIYCSPVVFPGLLCKDLIILKRGLKMISRVGGMRYDNLVNLVVTRHLSSCKLFADRILEDHSHPLHSTFSKQLSSSNTRTRFRHVSARTSKYRNSLIPFLCRFLNDESGTTQSLINRLI